MADHKLDIFAALAAMDRRDGGWLARQPEDARSSLSAPVFLRWASAMAGDGDLAEYTLIMVNERVNQNMFDLTKDYPDLVFRLAASCGLGRQQRHEWVGMVGRGRESSKLHDYVGRFFPGANDGELQMMLTSASRQDFLDFLDETGCPPTEASEMIKAHDKLHGNHQETKKPGRAKRTRRSG